MNIKIYIVDISDINNPNISSTHFVETYHNNTHYYQLLRDIDFNYHIINDIIINVGLYAINDLGNSINKFRILEHIKNNNKYSDSIIHIDSFSRNIKFDHSDGNIELPDSAITFQYFKNNMNNTLIVDDELITQLYYNSRSGLKYNFTILKTTNNELSMLSNPSFSIKNEQYNKLFKLV